MMPAAFVNGRGELICTGCGKPLPHTRCQEVDDNSGDLTIHELEEAAKRFCRLHWNCEYTGKIEIVSRRWKRQEACFIWLMNGENVEIIQFSRSKNKELGRERVLNNLLHELVHWRLRKLGKPSSDEDTEFAKECLRVGAPISGTQGAKRAAERALMTCNTSARRVTHSIPATKRSG